MENNIRWVARYSQTELPDKQGRWARICYFKGRTIAWITRVQHNEIVVFIPQSYFPVNGNDMPQLCATHFDTFNEAKEAVEYYWEQFLKICQYPSNPSVKNTGGYQPTIDNLTTPHKKI